MHLKVIYPAFTTIQVGYQFPSVVRIWVSFPLDQVFNALISCPLVQYSFDFILFFIVNYGDWWGSFMYYVIWEASRVMIGLE